MARFTFAAGNAGKLLRLPLYGLGAVAARLVPRSDRIWVVGSGIGFGEGAVPLARLARERLGDGHRVIWLAGSALERDRARAEGFETLPRDGARGLWATLRARVVIVTHGLGDANRYGSRGAFIVQLWHGIPLKRLHLDSPTALRIRGLPDHPRVRALLASAYRRAGRSIALFPVASDLVASRIVSAFGIAPSRVVTTGDPRDDVLFGEPDAARSAARRLIESAIGPLPATGALVLYAPTWRDGRPDPSIPTAAEWRAIAAWADRTESTLLVRTHPLGVGDYAAGPALSDRIRMLSPRELNELTPALPAIDVLVTDYSSAAFDFALLDRPIVYLAPDVEDYAKRRGLYTDFRDVTHGRQHQTWGTVLDELESLAHPDSPEAALARTHTRWMREEHFDLPDGQATERVFREILRRLAPTPTVPAGDPAPRFDSPARIARPRILEAELIEGGATAGELPHLELELSGLGDTVTGIELAGGRARVPAALDGAGGRVLVRIPLLAARWGSRPLALPSGAYELIVRGEVDSTRFDIDRPRALVLDHELFRATARADAGGFRVTIEAPLDADEQGPRAQLELEALYRASRGIREDAVYFESFYSRSVADNPLGIDRALARARPQTRRYWSVLDHSIEVPEGAIPIIEGSREWWRVRAAARVLVVNDWLRKRYRRRRYQHVLQTWHGTMVKRLALDRIGRPGLLGRLASSRTAVATRREQARWDVLLAQNPYSAEIFRSAYAMQGPIWVEGYPRDDVLHDPDPEARSARIRDRLGVASSGVDGPRIVLYAPTWRDDRTEVIDFLDVENFAAELGDDWIVLVRGHSRTLHFGRDFRGPNLIDVTSYPDVGELLLVADVLVTDYSSTMFDWMTTDKPIVFFTPDLAHYSTELRGFYFDFVAEAPGLVISDAAEVRAAVLTAHEGLVEFAERRAAWREKFTPCEDGRAGERVVQRMIDAGWFD
ncbi:CDP-glycerol glycerophosphotransferase family protein [uncultured Schumannella sp.]|uniref:CDP-glycerol glycerophosphotransferase family protein n=1 Tax=uncultured Schumannella sp. TaxID=1195956 RepID=UPI0025E28172|nr:CDP-glycerol glycerophosphotransferase family protein [uncultured Schumannella sp.]